MILQRCSGVKTKRLSIVGPISEDIYMKIFNRSYYYKNNTSTNMVHDVQYYFISLCCQDEITKVLRDVSWDIRSTL